jgi:hypothetical protein
VPREFDAGFGTADVYAVADQLGALPEDLPCMVFFTEPTQQRAVLVVQFSYLVPERPIRDIHLDDAFNAVTSALKIAAEEPPDKRLRRLERELGNRFKAAGPGRRIEVIGRAVGAVIGGAADTYVRWQGR